VTHRRQPASTGTSTPGRAAPFAAAHEQGGHRERGQATVELALLLPLVGLLLLALVQVAVVARDQVLVVHAAREAARAAAVDPDVDAARQAAEQAGPLAADRLTVEVAGRGEAGSRVRVVVSYIVPLRLPLLGAALGDVTLSSSATMRVER
jgi:Flp pilus assembly protein TadG